MIEKFWNTPWIVFVPTPAALFTASPNPAACQQPVSFNGSASSAGHPDRQIVSYSWNFGDGAVLTGGASSVNHAYAEFGSYNATLTVTDNSVPALSVSTSVLVEVSLGNQSPVANHGGPYGVDLGSSVQLNGGGSFDPNASCGDSITSYVWTIDGTIQLSGSTPIVNPLLLGLAAGNHALSLRVTDEFGLGNTVSTTLAVYNNVPTASFTADPTLAACNQFVSLNGSASSAGRPDRSSVTWPRA